jgi:hypothetical protein
MYLPLAFETGVLHAVRTRARDIPASFIGSVGPSHPERTKLLRRVSRDVSLDVWTLDGTALADAGLITVHPAAFGRPMYEILGRSATTLNVHAPWAGVDANNLRLFEATGMGSLLVTDNRRNLDDLFDVGREVVAYRTPDEAAQLLRQFVENPDEAARIAAAGQRRTLNDHTWPRRMTTVLNALPAL